MDKIDTILNSIKVDTQMMRIDQKTSCLTLRPAQTQTQIQMIRTLIRLQPTITMWAGDSWRRGTVEVVL